MNLKTKMNNVLFLDIETVLQKVKSKNLLYL
jgi:hypothetical protein